MRDVIEHDPYPLVLFDPTGCVEFANAAARDLGPEGACAWLSDLLPASLAMAACAKGAVMLTEGADPRSSWKIRANLVSGQAVDARVSVRGVTEGAGLVLRIHPARDSEDSDTVLRRLVAHTPGAGQDYFEQLVMHLTAKLGAKWAFVAELDDAMECGHTLAMSEEGVLQPSFSYRLSGTPCEDAVLTGACFVPEDAARAYPDDRLLLDMRVDSYLGVPLLSAEGQVLGVLALMHDGPLDERHDPVGFVQLFAARTATELCRRRAEAEAERQRLFTDRLLDQVDALVLVLDGQGSILRANRTVGRVTGWKEADLVGQSLCQTFASERASAAVQAALESAIPLVLEDTWTTPDGAQRQIRWQVRPVVEGSGPAEHLLVTGVDLTELEDARRERDALHGRLRQAKRLESLGRLAGGVAHDFNNLLLAILGYADLIRAAPDDVAEVSASALEICRAADHAASLTRQLLAFGRRQRLERRGVDLADVVESATAVLRPLLPANIDLVVELPDEPVPVRADPSRLEQVIVNLGANARDAMPDGGELRVRVQVVAPADSPLSLKGRPAALIEVSDTGTGIDATVMPHIFEPFFTTKDLGQGTGLGLASVYGTVQQHGGTVDVQPHPERGTTFRVFLPVDGGGQSETAEPRDSVAGPGAGRRILVAEDDERIRRLVGRLLEGAGYRVVAHPDGADAWEAFLARPTEFDLVLADVIMPNLGGVDLAARIRAHSPGKPVMLTSGFVAATGEFPPNVRLLSKPYMPDDLLSAVGEALAAS